MLRRFGVWGLGFRVFGFRASWDNGKGNGNDDIIIGYILGLYRDNGK